MKRIGFYAGSFDPPTFGHKWMIETALTLCDELYVGVGIHPTKKPLFTGAQRLGLLAMLMYDVGPRKNDLVYCTYEGATVIETMKVGATVMFRGIRSVSDFDYELMQRHVNDDIASAHYQSTMNASGTPPTSVFLAPPPDLAMVSSSMVKSLIGLPNWKTIVGKYTTPDIADALQRAYAKNI